MLQRFVVAFGWLLPIQTLQVPLNWNEAGRPQSTLSTPPQDLILGVYYLDLTTAWQIINWTRVT